jgi:glutamate 5-kinase
VADRRPGLRRTVVVKAGSSTLVDDAGRPRPPVFERLAGECAALVSSGTPVVVVSSGAVALGIGELQKTVRPRALGDLQAASALGQTLLQLHWERAFAALGVRTGQVLLTEGDIHRRGSYVNARRALRRLMSWGVVPVVNENDSTATDEITFGDNDALAAHVAVMLQARLLVLLTDIDGVYDRDPSRPDARLIPEILDQAQVDAVAEDAPAGASGWGSGGIAAKLRSARMASSAGVEAIIASGLAGGAIEAAASGAASGTRVPAAGQLPSAYKLWLRHGTPVRGRLVCDDGARRAVAERGTSLLPVGLVAVDGTFSAGDAVELVGPDGGAFAVGVSRYEAGELTRALGHRGLPEAVRRDDLVLL